MTGAENERLVRLETKFDGLAGDVSEIKGDVKLLMTAYLQDSGRTQGRRDMGVWVRSALPWLIGIGSALVTLFGIVTRI